MAAAMAFPLPRLPQALARHQEAHPLAPVRKEPPPQVLLNVISLKNMCSKWWIEKVQHHLRKDTSRHHLFSLQRFLSDLPREIRSFIICNGLKAGGLHLAHGSKEIPAVNRVLVFVSSDLPIMETIYITFPKSDMDGYDIPIDIELLCRYGEGALKMVISLPLIFSRPVKKTLTDLCRTCKMLTDITIHEANDDALALITRHCKMIQRLDVSGSEGVTDEGVGRAIVNIKWSDKSSHIKIIDVGGTSVTQDGLMQLLTRLPSITSFGSVDMVEAIEGVIILTENSNFSTIIEETTLKCTTVNRLQTLKKYCPNLTSIKATFHEIPGATLNDLRLLKNLVEVEIVVREPFLLSQAVLYEFIWLMGQNLVKLKVSGDVYWEADLGSIVGQCPFIRTLSFPAVTLTMKESLSVLMQKDSPTLTHLTVLEIDCLTGVGPKAWAKDYNLVRRGLILALQRAKLLRRLVLRPTSLVDLDLLDVLACNRFEKLEVLELYNTSLGLPSAKLLLDTCINLHVMKGLRTWRGMTLHDLMLLRKYSRGHRRTADLKIVP